MTSWDNDIIIYTGRAVVAFTFESLTLPERFETERLLASR